MAIDRKSVVKLFLRADETERRAHCISISSGVIVLIFLRLDADGDFRNPGVAQESLWYVHIALCCPARK